jgi:hypothetical protein
MRVFAPLFNALQRRIAVFLFIARIAGHTYRRDPAIRPDSSRPNEILLKAY